MQKFDAIRPFYDTEVNEALQKAIRHPMMKAIMNFTFPETKKGIWESQLKDTHSIRDFQCNFIYHTVQKILEKTSDGLTVSGFDQLEKNTAYLFISNHRDIILDATLLNMSLFQNDLLMTASAIGDNLVKKPFMKTLAKLNRNFLVLRELSPREMLQSSKLLSEYIKQMVLYENRSVWIAQREGRTKDGNDETNSGVLKMIGMASDAPNLMEYFKKIKLVPVSISYEYDPTDALKIPQLLAEAKGELYSKSKNEDFNTILTGVMGQKKRIHIHIGNILEAEIDTIIAENDNPNKQIQTLTQEIDRVILSNYKLWPTNFIACDLLQKNSNYSRFYTESEKLLFERRLEKRIDTNNPVALQGFLAMYANPVLNKLKYTTQLS